eukprot:CAMPEP_0184644516 /NCGR_PEP_ID=MMETSP0308-20130426/1223_1 /TAXON_ID=38269 /ORGANISM="Gloeochaete witrockiana, Strain SAG 46.84" /LENGTH=415 /DNA_ID=CAMNT_0027073093 /DNA_START=175 /DNA_END=1422 /DNA_ORIENTATION=+
MEAVRAYGVHATLVLLCLLFAVCHSAPTPTKIVTPKVTFSRTVAITAPKTPTKSVTPKATPDNFCPCLRRYTASLGSIVLSGYPGELECRWLVDGRPVPSTVDSQIYFELTKFSTDGNVDVDNIEVYNGVNSFTPKAPREFVDVWWATVPASLLLFGSGTPTTSASAGFQINYIINKSPLCSRQFLALELQAFGDKDLSLHDVDYAPNSACRWEYVPGQGRDQVNVMFQFYRVSLGSGADKLVGRSTSFPGGDVIGSFYNSTQTQASVFFVGRGHTQFALTTDESGNGKGFVAQYVTNKSTLCSTISQLYSKSGSMSDGAGSKYQSNSVCTYFISVPSETGTSIKVQFTRFDTEADYDFVHIYAGTTTNAPLVGQFSGNTIPPVLLIPAIDILVTFITDSSIVAKGWSLDYLGVF